jgi:hypothetical protein
MFPGLRGFRDMARLLALEAQVKRARSDWNGAMNSSLDGLKFAGDIQRGGIMITMLTGTACEAIARSQAWPSVEHLTAKQASAATKRLESIVASHIRPADTVQEEKWMGQSALMQLFSSPNWQQQVAGGMGAPPSWRNNLRFLFLDKRQVLENYSRYMDIAIANAKLPYRASQQPLPPIDDPISQMFLPGFYNLRWSFALNETQNSLLLLALALRAYRLDNSAYPKSLSQLSPRYLKAIPRDPLAPDGAFSYVAQGAKYLLYSVGPDGKDDQGTPIHARQPGTMRRGVQEDSRGDIVARIDIAQSNLFF